MLIFKYTDRTHVSMNISTRIVLSILVCFALLVCPVLASNITTTNVISNNIDGTTSVFNIAPPDSFNPATDTSASITNNKNVFVSYTINVEKIWDTNFRYTLVNVIGSNVKTAIPPILGTELGVVWDFSGKGNASGVSTTSFIYDKDGVYTTTAYVINELIVNPVISTIKIDTSVFQIQNILKLL